MLGLSYYSVAAIPLVLITMIVMSNPNRTATVHRHALQALTFLGITLICAVAQLIFGLGAVPFIIGMPFVTLVSFRYGAKVWNGEDIRVPLLSDWLDTRSLSAALIRNEPNLEVRRDLVNRYGMMRFLRDIDSQVIAVDSFGRLLRCDMPGDEPWVMVEVVNSTPERVTHHPSVGEAGVWLDGRWFKKYVLRVDPACRTPREAVAWTFGCTPESYSPVIQT